MAKIVRLSKKQIEARIDRDARRRLGISGQEFRKQLKAGRLDTCIPAVYDTAMLVRLSGDSG